MTATTALTAQNTMGVDDIHQVPPEFTRKQIDAVFRDIPPSVVKTGASSYWRSRLPHAGNLLTAAGMLSSAATIKMLAQALVDYKVKKLVLDPVGGKYLNDNLCRDTHFGDTYR